MSLFFGHISESNYNCKDSINRTILSEYCLSFKIFILKMYHLREFNSVIFICVDCFWFFFIFVWFLNFDWLLRNIFFSFFLVIFSVFLFIFTSICLFLVCIYFYHFLFKLYMLLHIWKLSLTRFVLFSFLFFCTSFILFLFFSSYSYSFH